MLFSIFKKKSTERPIYKVADADIYSKEFQQNFYKHYPAFYDLGDVVFLEKSNCYAVFRYESARTVLNNHETFSSSHLKTVDAVLLGADGKKHLRNKKVVLQNIVSLNREQLHTTNDFFHSVFEKLWSSLSVDSSVNIVDKLVNPLTLTLIFHELGIHQVPEEWNVFSDKTTLKTKSEAIAEVFSDWNLLNDLVAHNLKEEHLREKLKRLLQLINSEGWYSPEELSRFVRLFIMAGAETTASLIASSIYLLTQRSNDVERLRNHSGYVTDFLNETLRLYAPAQFTFRYTEKEAVVGKQKIPAGSVVAIAIGAANRDPAIFEQLDVFMPGRTAKHIAFGMGRHKCVGEYLSAYLAQMFLGKLLLHWERFDFAKEATVNNTVFAYKVSNLNATLRK